MSLRIRIGLIGDFDSSVMAHRAIPQALTDAAPLSDVQIDLEWVPTREIESTARVSRFDGLWCVPGSPYQNMEGALLAVRFARESAIPFLGTCGGFQHVIIEYARNVCGWSDADHAETSPHAARAVIAALECSLVEASEQVRLLPRTRIAAAYGVHEITARYHCRYGLNEQFRTALDDGALRVTAEDQTGAVRAVELAGDAFFVATLFQPERAALLGEPVPLATALINACMKASGD